MAKKKFYVTTPIYYINDNPHLGSAYTTFVADTFARYYRLKGYEVFFLTGLDENSQKTVDSSKANDRDLIQEYADMMAVRWEKTWERFNITNNGFIRTTAPAHTEFVKEFFEKVNKKGDIYKGSYEGHYCEGCEAFYREEDLVDKNCPLHKKPTKWLKEENYFFKLSKYQDKLLRHIEEHPEFILPEFRRNEIVNFIKSGLKDISISRPNKVWGIPLPIDETHVIYVWFDALINYLSAIDRDKYWPADLHLVGKDIQRFHCTIWPAMLMSAGYQLPKHVFSHGFITINGEKMSKSLGNAVKPIELSKKYGTDAMRYYLLREIPFGNDGDFSEQKIKDDVNNELANDLGNLVSRVIAMVERYYQGTVPDGSFDKSLLPDITKIDSAMEAIAPDKALDYVWEYIRVVNKYVNDTAPWELNKSNPEKLKDVIYTLVESVRFISIMTAPFLPETALQITKQLNIKPGTFDDIKPGMLKDKKVQKGEILFKKIEDN